MPIQSPQLCLDLLARPDGVHSHRSTIPDNDGQRNERQHATARFLEVYGPALLAAPRHDLLVRPGPGRDAVLLRLRTGSGPGGVDPSLFGSLVPAERYVVRGVPRFARVSGQGTPCVGTLRPLAPVHGPDSEPAKPVAGIAWAVTAVPQFRPASGGDRAILSLDLYDPHTTGRVGGTAARTAPLAADYSTPLAVAYQRIGPERRGLRGFLGASRDFASAGIYASEKPTPDKIPLLLVHGLISDPSDFHDLHNALESDPLVRSHYQVWFFYYPSSLPVVYSAMLLREDLDRFIHQLDPHGVHPALHRTVLVGHSMGGLLCRLAISDGGDRYYHHFFRRGLDELKLTPGQRELTKRAFYYHADPNVSQTVFIATPHQGSVLASNVLGRLGRMLVRVPRAVRGRIDGIISQNRRALAAGGSIKPTSSLDSLGPHDPLIAAINDVAMRPEVKLHSILGNRGRGGPPERSTDGVVSYASSHLPQAASELIMPAGHTGTLKRPETADEIIRILDEVPSGDGRNRPPTHQAPTAKRPPPSPSIDGGSGAMPPCRSTHVRTVECATSGFTEALSGRTTRFTRTIQRPATTRSLISPARSTSNPGAAAAN